MTTRAEQISASVDAARGLEASHPDATVFIVGAGPQLAELTAEQIAALGDAVTIGVNLTQYVVSPRYFLSGHAVQVAIAAHTAPDATLLHMRRGSMRPMVSGSVVIGKLPYHPETDGLDAAFSGIRPQVRTSRNVALAATHLAMIMGASRVAYVGVEQRSAEHFYHRMPAVRDRIKTDIQRIREDEPTVDRAAERLLARLDEDADPTAKPFYQDSHEASFRGYFESLRVNDVEPIATTAESVVADAGATVMPLDAVLAEAGP